MLVSELQGAICVLGRVVPFLSLTSPGPSNSRASPPNQARAPAFHHQETDEFHFLKDSSSTQSPVKLLEVHFFYYGTCSGGGVQSTPLTVSVKGGKRRRCIICLSKPNSMVSAIFLLLLQNKIAEEGGLGGKAECHTKLMWEVDCFSPCEN